jgi:acyl dehydratase
MTRRVSGLWFEELIAGLTVEHVTTRTVTETDNVLFTTMTMNPQPLHLDVEFAARSEFGKPLVNRLFTSGLVVGLAVPELTLGTTIANLGSPGSTSPRQCSPATPSTSSPLSSVPTSRPRDLRRVS